MPGIHTGVKEARGAPLSVGLEDLLAYTSLGVKWYLIPLVLNLELTF